MVAAVAKRVPVMELEKAARGASTTLPVHVAASPAIALVHDAPHRGRDVARGRRRVAVGEALPRGVRLREAPGFEPLELLGDGVFDDRAEVAVGHRGAHERRESLELVAQIGAGGELDLVATEGERLHTLRPRPTPGTARG